MSKLPKYKKPHVPSFDKVAQALEETAREVVEEHVGAFAESERTAFKRKIEQQDFLAFDAAPLSPRYAAWKASRGLDPRVMIATGNYKDALRVLSQRTSKTSRTYHVGFDSRRLVRDADGKTVPFPLWKLAWVHEKGSVKMNIPRRPHWGPHLKVMRMHAPLVRVSARRATLRRLKKRLPWMA